MINEIYVFLTKGGIMMVPLVASSIVALAIIIERALQLKRKKVLDPHVVKMMDSIREPKDIDAAQVICDQSNSVFTSIIKFGLDNRDLPHEELKELLEDQGRQEARILERGLGALETVAAAAPLMGLLGTVIGMIKVFNVISQVGVGQASALSGGISEALITTVVGLSIGIPTLISYNYFINKAENLILDIEKYLMVLMQKIRQLGEA
jgi:biopolymer transport protein ExbB